MKFWYFKFHGKYSKDSSNYGEGVYSGCLIPDSNRRTAKAEFLSALIEERIILEEILDSFALDGHELDPSDRDNDVWIDLYQQAEKLKTPIFTTLHLYDLSNEN